MRENSAHRWLGGGGRHGERETGRDRLFNETGDSRARGHRAGLYKLGVDGRFAPMQFGEQLALALSIGGKGIASYEILGENGGHPLFPAADQHLLGIVRIRPVHGYARFGECLVERGKMPEAFGVGEHAITIEQQSGHAYDAFPALPKVVARDTVSARTSANTSRNSVGGSHFSVTSEVLSPASIDCI